MSFIKKMRNKNPIYVTRPSTPPLTEFVSLLKEIWDSKILTNNGPFHQKFEHALAERLGVKYLSVFSNGTLALITALHALEITGEVITTPFSFVATTHALWWNNITPVFVDIEPNCLTLDPEKIESAITSSTTAILPVHIYGYPCDVERLQKIAEKHKLKLIYDAAHSFGVEFNGNSILNFGDLSILSFHATKVFNSVEGGAIICRDQATFDRVNFLKNFGFADETIIVGPGINAKMNELQAAYGLIQLNYINENIMKRKVFSELYWKLLHGIAGLHIVKPEQIGFGLQHNYSYLPILIDEKKYGISRDGLYAELKKLNIFTRRYFYPLISQIPLYRNLPSARSENLPIAEKIAQQILCLPLYPALSNREVTTICRIIKALYMKNPHVT